LTNYDITDDLHKKGTPLRGGHFRGNQTKEKDCLLHRKKRRGRHTERREQTKIPMDYLLGTKDHKTDRLSSENACPFKKQGEVNIDVSDSRSAQNASGNVMMYHLLLESHKLETGTVEKNLFHKMNPPSTK